MEENEPGNGVSKPVKVLLVIILIVLLGGVLLAAILAGIAGSRLAEDDEPDVSRDYDVKRYEMGKEAAGYMASGDAKMEEARNIYNKLDEAESVLLLQLAGAGQVDLEGSIEWIRTLEGKARASLAEAGTYYDLILEMRYVDDYAGYAGMQKDVINLYDELFAAQDDFIEGLASGADPEKLTVDQLQYITELTRAIDEAAGLAADYQQRRGL